LGAGVCNAYFLQISGLSTISADPPRLADVWDYRQKGDFGIIEDV
jgi:hypothetical protein